MDVFKLDFKSQIKGCILWTGIVALMLIMFMAFFPAMQTKMMQELVTAKLDALPPALLLAFGLADMPDLTQITPFFAYMMQYINLAAAIYAALLGSSALIKEESEGTIEYLYAQPVTRRQIVAQKMLSALAIYSIFVAVLGVVTTILFALFKPVGADLFPLYLNIKIILGGTFFVGLIFMAIGFLASVLLRHVRQTASFSLGVVFVTFIFGLLGTVIDNLEFLKYLSPIDNVKPNKLLSAGFDTSTVIVGLIVIALAALLTFVTYQRKDLKS